MIRNSGIKYFRSAALTLLVLGSSARAETVNLENQPMQFSYTTNGSADGSINSYGNNAISVSGDTLRVQIGNSSLNRNINGVGIYDLNLTNHNLENARKLAELLCYPKDLKSGTPTSDLYTAKCSGKMRSGYARDFSRDVTSKIADLVDLLTNLGVQEGRRLVKLDVSLISIERAEDSFLVSIRFSNGGDYPIKFKTPDRWDAKIGKHMEILGVNGSQVNSRRDKLALALAGQPLVDPKKFPDGKIVLAGHSSVEFKLKTNSIEKFSAGEYNLNAGAFMDIEVVGIQSSLLRVDFHSDYKNPTRITFDRDYPSNPGEREQWEAKHRQDMSWWPVMPGKTFAEDGLYRAVTLIHGVRYRSLQVKPFKAGAVATTENVKMPMENGIDIDGPVQWEWEATAPTPIKQWSLDIVDDTRQFSASASTCPRSGRWVARTNAAPHSLNPQYRHDLSSLVTLRRGQPMPSIKGATEQTDWEWVGA